MSRIRSKDTGPEIWVRKVLFSNGYRYRKNVMNVQGHPDIWMPGFRTAIFVHGCFWHRHSDCKYAYMPKSRVEFWNSKFEQNVLRDRNVREELLKEHIRIIIIWECTVNKLKSSPEGRELLIHKISSFLDSKEMVLEM